MGLVVTIVLCIACYFLFKSFLRHLKRVPASFDEPDQVGGPLIKPITAPVVPPDQEP